MEKDKKIGNYALFGLFILTGSLAIHEQLAHKSHDMDMFFADVATLVDEAKILADEKGKIIVATTGVLDVTGYDKDELRGMHISELVPERFLKQHQEAYDKAINLIPSKSVNIDCFLKTKDGSERRTDIRVRVMVHPQLGIVSVGNLTLTKDIEKVEMR